jgi:hypothetical protein
MNFENPSENIRFPHLATELQAMVDVDQDMRNRRNAEGYWDETLDAKHTERLKEIIAEIGWPTISKVGETGSANAHLLAQHADHDVDFQVQCLNLMKEAPSGEVDVADMAYLEDRVRVNHGKEQIYGTQFIKVDGKHIPQPIEDEENVDKRRAEVGLEPLSEYAKLFKS